MKTKLEKLANEMNLFPIHSIPEKFMNDEYFKDKYEKYYLEKFGNSNVPDEYKALKNAECGYFVQVCEQFTNKDHTHELYYIEHEYFLISHINYDFICIVRESWKTKRNYLHPFYDYINKLSRNLTTYQTEKYLKLLKEPNNFSLPTDKKIDDYFKYCDEYLKALKSASEEVTGKKSDNETIIQNFIDSLTDKTVSKYLNVTRVKTKYFDIIFELQDNGAYLNKKIQYTGSLENIVKIEN